MRHRGGNSGATGCTHDHLDVAVPIDEHGWHRRGQWLLLRCDVIIGTGRYTKVIDLQRNAEVVHGVIQHNAGSPADYSASKTARLSDTKVYKENLAIPQINTLVEE